MRNEYAGRGGGDVKKDRRQTNGQALTRELLWDAYASGTSDGVQQQADHEMRIEAEPYEDEAEQDKEGRT